MEGDLKWNGEVILADALDNVLKNLNTGDLSRAAQVCKSWNQAVQLEFSRRGPERILIPNPNNPTFEDSKFCVENILSTKPNLMILFCGPNPHMRSKLNLEIDKVLNAYKNRFPAGTRLIIVGVDKAMDDRTEIVGCSTLFDGSGTFNILGLALPSYRNAKIEVAYCVSHEGKSASLAQQVVQKLTPETSDQKSILIVLGRTYYSVSEEVLKIIKNTWKSDTYTLWGGTTQNYLKIISCRDGDFPSYMGMQGVICIKIVGQGLEAHSTTVDWTLKEHAMREKLLEFKSRLNLKRRKLGLACGSNEYVSSDALVEMIKEVFPEIPFTSFFNCGGRYFGLDSMSEDPDQELVHTACMSIMILTYD